MSTLEGFAIVTCCRDYGRYLVDWARSLVAMDLYPSLVTIVDAGSVDETPAQVEQARAILTDAGIEVLTQRIESRNIGQARNAAVALAEGCEWVQHLDCDDTAMPHMLSEFRKYMDRADVIGAGYERSGDLAAGPRNRRRLYSSHRGVQTLKSKAPCSGVSPFRRAFWERAPYREDMEGGWDTALWLGFAHQDPPARFIATKRPVFYYRQHRGSTFNTRRLDPWKSALVGRKLNQLRRGFQGVSVLVPWQPDGGARDRAWEWVRRRYEQLHPDWEVVVGTCPGPDWRKGVALNDALSRATGDVLVLADADCVVAPEALEQAVEVARGPDGWVVPHTMVHRLDEPSTNQVLAQEPEQALLDGRCIRAPYEGFAGGGLVVVERCRFEAAGGIPEAFVGWGAEDETLALILDALVAPHVRLAYDLWHLWHPQGKRARDQHYRRNKALFRRVQQLADNPRALFDLVQDLRTGSRGRRGQKDGVLMVALMDFQRGSKRIPEGDTFLATEEEVRRHAARPAHRRLAERVNGQVFQDLRAASEARTLAIREEQRRRNEAARAEKDLALRKLARAGTRTKAEVSVGPDPNI